MLINSLHITQSPDFKGMELIDPGLVSIVDWRPKQEPNPGASAADTAMYGAVAQLQ